MCLFSWASPLNTAAIRALISLNKHQMFTANWFFSFTSCTILLCWIRCEFYRQIAITNLWYNTVGFQDKCCWFCTNMLYCQAKLPRSSPVPNAASSAASARSGSAICRNSPCPNVSKCLWQKWLTSNTDAHLLAFLRPKDAQRIEWNRDVTETSDPRSLCFFHGYISCAEPTLVHSTSFLRPVFIWNYFKICTCSVQVEGLFPGIAVAGMWFQEMCYISCEHYHKFNWQPLKGQNPLRLLALFHELVGPRVACGSSHLHSLTLQSTSARLL